MTATETFYLSKYTPTTGNIIRFQAVARSWGDGTESVKRPNEPYTFHVVGRDAFRSESEALAAAEKARSKKVASLEKQLAKLKAQTFKVVDQ